MANNYIPGFTPSLHGQPVKRMALGGRMESGRWFNEGRDRDTGGMPYTPEVASAAPAVAQSIASSPVAAPTAAPTAATPTAATYQQPSAQPVQAAPANYGFDPYDLSGFDMYGLGEYASQFYQQPTPQPAQAAPTGYQSLPTSQPVQTAPYADYATPTSYQQQPTAQPVQTAPYYGGYDFGPYGIGDFNAPSYAALASPQSNPAAAQSQPAAQPTVASADYSQFIQPYAESFGAGALTGAKTQATPASYSPPAASAGPTPPGALPPGMSWGAYSTPNDPTSQYVVNFSGKNKNNPLKVGPDTPVFLYDNRTKQIVASGIGREGADAVAAAASSLGAKKDDAWWDIYTGPAGATDPSQFKVALSDAKNKNFGQRFLSAMGTILPIATAFIPGLGQAGLLTQIGAGAASGAAGAALKGQNILTGALTGGATAGLLNAPVLSGGKNLSGVIGGALEKVPLVGDALKDVTGALNKAGGSTWNQAANEIVTTATKSAAAPLVDKAAAALIGSAAFQPDLSGLDQLSFQYGLPEVSQQPPVEEEGVASTVIGRKPSDLAPIAGGVAGSVVSGYDPVKNEITAVADKTKPELDDTASGAAQAAANEIVVTADKKPTSLDDLATGAIGAIAPSLLQPGPQAPTTPPKKDGLSLEDYLRIAGLIASGIGGLGGKGGGGGLSSFAGARGPLNPIFSAKLPAPNLQPATPRALNFDAYRYGYGPEQSFLSNVPQGAANTSTAYTGYGTSPRYNATEQYAADIAALLNAPQAAATAQPAQTAATAAQPAQTAASLARTTSQPTGGALSAAQAPRATPEAYALPTDTTPIPGLSPAQQLYYRRIAPGATLDKAQYDYVKGLSDYQALASLSNYDSLLGSTIYNDENGFRTMDELEAYYNTPLYTYGGDTQRTSKLPGYAVGGYAVGGPGDGRDDKIPAMLSDGEYVMDAETVAMLGNGSSKAGADALDKFRVNIRKHKGRKLSKGEFSVDAKKPEQYLKGHK